MAVQPMDMKKCIHCGMCEQFCPVDVIRFDNEKKEPYIAYFEDCMLCGLCEDRCPANAITVTPDKAGELMLCWR